MYIFRKLSLCPALFSLPLNIYTSFFLPCRKATSRNQPLNIQILLYTYIPRSIHVHLSLSFSFSLFDTLYRDVYICTWLVMPLSYSMSQETAVEITKLYTGQYILYVPIYTYTNLSFVKFVYKCLREIALYTYISVHFRNSKSPISRIRRIHTWILLLVQRRRDCRCIFWMSGTVIPNGYNVRENKENSSGGAQVTGVTTSMALL